jgi:K+-transporting ATPase A subunit
MKEGWVIYGIMLVLFVLGFGALYAAELADNPLIK